MKKTSALLTIGLVLMLVLVACGGEEESDMSPTTGPIEPSPEAPQATEAYPGPDATDSEPPPPPATLENIYPADQIFVAAPAGLQCEEPKYETINDARAALEDAGVDVLSIEEDGRMVCEACDCPTSLHFRARIASEDLDIAKSLGWDRE